MNPPSDFQSLTDVDTKMSRIIPMFCTFSWFVIQLMFMNSVANESLAMYNNNETELPLGRSRRSIDRMPIILTLWIRYPSGGIVELNLLKQPQHLVNKYLPVVTPADYPHRNVMERLGEFLLYHDEKTCSALIYLENLRLLTGVIGSEYSLWKSSFEVDNDGNHLEVIGGVNLAKNPLMSPHYVPISSHNAYQNPVEAPSINSGGRVRQPSYSEPRPSSKRRRLERDIDDEFHGEVMNRNISEIHNIRKRRWNPLKHTYYIEILVFASHDFAELYKPIYGPEFYINALIRNQIAYFNAVDMIFQSLGEKKHELKINIAKVIIEDGSELFDFTGSDNKIELSESFARLRAYLTNNPATYPVDSFDHVFLFTSRTIMDGHLRMPTSTQYAEDLYEDRKNGFPYNAVPITVMSHTSNYALAVHEIARTLGIEVDLPGMGLGPIGQCSSLMQAGGSKCNRCLKWLESHKKEFTKFIKMSRNRCFLMNEPRSVRPPRPHRFVSATKQCQCFGYDYYMVNNKPAYNIPTRECNKPLQCGKAVNGGVRIQNTILPFDGAYCGSNNKACWAGNCE